MSDYNWCHGPNCHTQQTQSRVRGSGDNKVLRTRRIKVHKSSFAMDTIYSYFCNQSCLMDFIRTHLTSLLAIAPRREALETPIKVEKEKYESHRYRYTDNGHTREPYIATRTKIIT
jgi:hypothetical protein|tara:strand:+ start:59 stop:406 length:348 start_codon:yes stop_codon:yes gene_type:complete